MSKRRNKGEGSITKLPNGKYKVTITLGKGIDGKQKRKTKTVATKAEAVKTLKELSVKYNTSDSILQELQGAELFAAFLERFLEQKKVIVAPSTYIRYKSFINKYVIPTLGSFKIKDITTTMINSLLMSLKEKSLSATTIKLRRTTLSTIFNEAVKQNIITKNPVTAALNIKGNRTRKNKLNLPTEAQIQSLLQLLKEKHYILYILVALELATGLRRGEILGLKWSCVDFNNSIIDINSQTTQTGRAEPLKTPSSYRRLYVNPTVLNLLKDIARNDDGFVFPYTCPNGLTIIMRRYFKKAGFDSHVTFHDLRHYHATQLLNKGVNIKIISKRLGHSNASITLDIYVHYLPCMDLEASQLIGSEYVLTSA